MQLSIASLKDLHLLGLVTREFPSWKHTEFPHLWSTVTLQGTAVNASTTDPTYTLQNYRTSIVLYNNKNVFLQS